MSALRELLRDLAPGAVRNVALGEIGEFIRGRRFTKADYVDSGLGSIHYGEIYTDYGTTARSVHRFVRPELKGRLRLARRGDLVIAATGENVQDVCKAVAWLGDEEVAVHDDCYIFRHELDPTYAAYLFQSAVFNDQKARLASESKLARISGASLAKIVAPVPPMSVQREVVAVLDRFSALQAELEAQLEAEVRARRVQFRHYRDALLSFDADLSLSLSLSLSRRPERYARLSELFDLRAGRFLRASQISAEAVEGQTVPCFGGGGLRGYVAVPSHTEDRILIGRQGALCGSVRRVRGPFYATEHAVVVNPKRGVDDRWAFHMLTWMNLHQYASKSAQPGLAVANIARLQVAVPTLGDQQAIGRALDGFDHLVGDLSIGLPAEIALRRRQYEYYRDKLLAFEEAA